MGKRGTVNNSNADGSTRVIEGIAPGLELIGEPGEKIEGFSPNKDIQNEILKTMLVEIYSILVVFRKHIIRMDDAEIIDEIWSILNDRFEVNLKYPGESYNERLTK